MNLKSKKWIVEVLSLEIKRLVAYRLNFWVQTIGSVAMQFIIAMFLWSSIFEYRGVSQIEGYTFSDLILYYLIMAFLLQVVRGPQFGHMWREIYDGTLTRYLVYPISFFSYKYATYVAFSIICIFQLIFALILHALFVEHTSSSIVNLASFSKGIVSSLAALTLYFLLSALFELISFWVEYVWSLLEMLRFTSNLMGGALIPLALFPEWGRNICYFTPFPYLFSFPVESFMGTLSFMAWMEGLFIISLWIVVLAIIVNSVWKVGLKSYSGVGI